MGKPGRASVDLSFRNKQICEEYLAGHALETVGQKYDLTRERVRQILVKNGHVERHNGFQSEFRRAARNKHETAVAKQAERKAKRDAQIAATRKLYDAGCTYADIAAALSISVGCVENYVWLSGKPSRNRNVGKSNVRLTDADRDIIARRYYAREAVRIIAADFDICDAMVGRIANELGFFRKPPRKNRAKAIAVPAATGDGA